MIEPKYDDDLDPATARIEDFDKWDGTGLPTRGNCDLSNPRQMFLWQYTALPGVVGAPMVWPVEYWELISFRQWQLGARLADDPVLKYQPSTGSMLDAATAAGRWVTLDTPDPEAKTLADVVEEMPLAHQQELRQVVLDKMGFGPEDVAASRAGHMQITELAQRLKINPDRLITVLKEFGMYHLTPESFVERETGERLVAHLGL